MALSVIRNPPIFGTTAITIKPFIPSSIKGGQVNLQGIQSDIEAVSQKQKSYLPLLRLQDCLLKDTGILEDSCLEKKRR